MPSPKITLADFSIHQRLSVIKYQALTNTSYQKLLKYLNSRGVDNFQKLVNAIKKCPEKIPEDLKKRIAREQKKIEDYIQVATKQGYTNPKFRFKRPTGLNKEQRQVLNEFNDTISADILPWAPPTSNAKKTKKEFQKTSVSTLKKSLSQVAIDSNASLPKHKEKNCIVNALSHLNLPSTTIAMSAKIADAIRVHDDLIATQIINAKKPIKQDKQITLMDDLDERKRKVAKKLAEIAQYIIDNRNEFVWGEIPETQIFLYNSLNHPPKELRNERRIAETLTEYLAFYFPLDWIEDGLLNERELTFVRDGKKVTDKVRPIDLLKKRVRTK